MQDDDMFAYNEVASLGVLSSAAHMAGFSSLMEYVSIKNQKNDRRKKSRNSRADLWIQGDTRSWSFEAKQLNCYDKISEKQIQKKLNEAISDTRSIQRSEADTRAACLIINMNEIYHYDIEHNYNQCKEFSNNNTQLFCWSIETKAQTSATFFLFKIVS
jgi:hypothetical protein